MKGAATLERMAIEQDQRISEVVKREQSRLRNFIRRRVPDPRDAEDILQDVFYELVEANRLLMPIEHVTGWLFRVARNRITDLFRKKKPESFSHTAAAHQETDDDEFLRFDDLLPSPDAGPDALYARNLLSFLALLVDKDKGLKIDTADEIIKATLLTENGAVVNPLLGPPAAAEAAASN